MAELSLNHGLYNGEWQKQPILIGVSGGILARISLSPTIAGTNAVDGGIVPAGEIWEIHSLTLLSEVAIGTGLRAILVRGADTVRVFVADAPTIAYTYTKTTRFVMFSGDLLRLVSIGDPGGASIFLDYIGIRCDIDQ